MRALVLLCLLHNAYGLSVYDWYGSDETPDPPPDVCLTHQAACGCCLMERSMYRMESFFNISYKALEKFSQKKIMINNLRASRSAFSVALNDQPTFDCYGPFPMDEIVVYKHVFINLGESYSTETGIFTAPLSGVYTVSVTVYGIDQTNGNEARYCVSLHKNGVVLSDLPEKPEQDPQDSGTVYMVMRLQAGDQLEVVLAKGCFICDFMRHYNTFTAFLLYAN